MMTEIWATKQPRQCPCVIIWMGITWPMDRNYSHRLWSAKNCSVVGWCLKTGFNYQMTACLKLAWWLLPVISTLGRWRQKNHHGFEFSLGLTVSSRLSWAMKGDCVLMSLSWERSGLFPELCGLALMICLCYSLSLVFLSMRQDSH